MSSLHVCQAWSGDVIGPNDNFEFLEALKSPLRTFVKLSNDNFEILEAIK